MKILVPGKKASHSDCDSFRCPDFDCMRYYVNGKEQKLRSKQAPSPICSHYSCDRVTMGAGNGDHFDHLESVDQ